MNQQKHQNFVTICRTNHWKCTPQRLTVYSFVEGNQTHPGVDEVWSHVKQVLPSVTRESIYRILNEFADLGLLHRLNHIDRAHYDSQTTPHGHFVCEVCGEISDFDIPDNSVLAANSVSGSIHHIELRVSGVCDKCILIAPKNKRGEENHA